MINSKVEEILNAQINKEFYSAYLYLAMSGHFDSIGLKGFANWTKVQAREEMDHGLIIFDYIIARNGKVNLHPIEAPVNSFGDTLEIFEMILAHEKSVTESIESVANLSEDECDRATRLFIDWYIGEQVEEEAQVIEVIKKIKMFGTECSILYHLDKEIMAREYKSHNYSGL